MRARSGASSTAPASPAAIASGTAIEAAGACEQRRRGSATSARRSGSSTPASPTTGARAAVRAGCAIPGHQRAEAHGAEWAAGIDRAPRQAEHRPTASRTDGFEQLAALGGATAAEPRDERAPAGAASVPAAERPAKNDQSRPRRACREQPPSPPASPRPRRSAAEPAPTNTSYRRRRRTHGCPVVRAASTLRSARSAIRAGRRLPRRPTGCSARAGRGRDARVQVRRVRHWRRRSSPCRLARAWR